MRIAASEKFALEAIWNYINSIFRSIVIINVMFGEYDSVSSKFVVSKADPLIGYTQGNDALGTYCYHSVHCISLINPLDYYLASAAASPTYIPTPSTMSNPSNHTAP